MCPSFRVTREEEHSTRGRAHLLWEMTKGEVIGDSWRDQHVKSSLDLCLSCKGCKSDCPVGVDVATYKAEFLSHYYDERPRPLGHYAFGHIDRWSRLASIAPGWQIFLLRLPEYVALPNFRWPAHQREIPRFAGESFPKLV